jgi:FkbM family methyltransferase
VIKNSIKKLINTSVMRLSRTSAGRYAYQQLLDSAMTRSREVQYRSHQLTLAAPNWLNNYRIDTFATKEPETLDWIDSIPEGAVLWDVGANVGLYGIYAAKARKCQVYAFEPSVFNLELLARNIFLNGVQKRVVICPFALSDVSGVNSFRLSTTAWGGALSAFGATFDQNGAALREIFEYQIFGLAIADVVDLLNIPQPGYMKVDVDGIEHFILRGARDVLIKVESVLIEINDAFPEQAEEATRLLTAAGLLCERKCDLGVPNMINQWWVRAR